MSRATTAGDTAADARSADGAGAAEVVNPPPVIRGEEKTAQRSHVDWVNCTFPAPSISVEGLIALLCRMLGRPVSGHECGGMLGFEKAVKLSAHHGSDSSPIGCIAYGGGSQNGRWLFQLTGVGCGFVKDWEGLSDLLQSLDAKLTRVDLAVDYFDGEYTVEDAMCVHECGGFSMDGKMQPKSSLMGDWLGLREGRTLYIGKAKNGKMLRVYEKGRQLGDPDSDWTRFEVQLGNRDREIHFDVLTEPDGFFVGAYPALADLIDVAARRIRTFRPDNEISLAKLAYHLKRCYGKVINTLTVHASASHAELIEGVSISALPRRLNLSCIAAGVTWADVFARMKEQT